VAQGVKTVAQRLGFQDCRIAAVKGPSPHAAEFQEWLDAGHHGTMTWLEKTPHRRKDPREVLQGARTVISVALNYYQDPPPISSPAPPDPSIKAPVTGQIARYAWGDDYHDVMNEKLRDLCHYLESMGGIQRLYADTGPVLERDWASAAGLGWNGKSTVQIHPSLGCYFFLGEILTTLHIAPDQPMPDHCGKCTRCITACPTQAIIAPHQLDARRCISYLTIEHKGPIPGEFRRAIGDRIYGCDDCLSACPWNRFARASADIAFAARPFVHQWPLGDFLSLTDSTFPELFRHSPIRRIKRPAFLRNVCIALGNTGTSNDLPALQSSTQDSNEVIAEAAHWAVAEIHRRLD
jgi:epoxyqueuosine reductase